MPSYKQNRMHRQNLSVILKALITHAPISRVELSRLTSMGKMSVTNYVSELIDRGYVHEIGTLESENGRKPILLDVSASFPILTAIQITRHYISAALVNLKGQISNVSMSPIDSTETSSSILSKTIMLVDKIITPEIYPSVWAIGVTAMGPISSVTNRIDSSQYYFKNFDQNIYEELQKRYNLPVFLSNDVNALALAEKYFGNAKQLHSFAIISSSIGLGCGIVVNNRLFQGEHGYGAEIGHITVEMDGPKCYCGNRGCLELYAAIPQIIQWIQEEHQKRKIHCDFNNWHDLLDGARHGNALCLSAIDRLTEYLAAGFVTLVNLFSPQCIFLGEDYCLAADLLADKLERQIEGRKFSPKKYKIPVKPSYFMGAAPLIGPATYAMVQMLDNYDLK